MNKRQLTITIAVLALTLGLFALFMAGRNDRAVRQHIKRIGNELISTTNSPHLVFLGSATQSRLAAILSSTALWNVSCNATPQRQSETVVRLRT